MSSVTFGRSASACGLDCNAAHGCVSMCGMCPPCVFAPRPPGSAQRMWTVSDEFRRRFVVELLLRCGNAQVLEGVRSVLGVTSWTLFAYARSRGPASARGRRHREADRAAERRPLGIDVAGIWDWFARSPDWLKSRYLCCVFSRCDAELLRMVSNLSSVLLVRQKRGFLQLNSSSRNTNQHAQDTDEDSEDPALMVVPGSSKSVSGVSRYRDFIGCLPVDLSKRILGLLEEHTLRRCQRVCRCWQHLAKETVEELKFSRHFQDQFKAMMKSRKSINIVSPTYSSIVEVLVPTQDDERADVRSSVQKVRPFEAAYAKVRTRAVLMEERNVYCGAYFTKVLQNKEDAHRVVDYRGRSFMATGSKDRVAQLFYVSSQTNAVSVMRGHVGSIRAVLLCEDRDLLVTASCDASIRCWSLKSDRCEMVLYGHTGTVNCLDVHADRLASGAKDCLVKVWDLHTGKQFEDFNFKHPSSIQCVKIDATKVYSSCDRGLVKIWDIEKASLLRVIDAHRSSVKCLFFDEWHLLSGDFNGQVMAWSISCHAKECLATFSHPKEVKSLTLVYLRVVTGCVDGKIRIFNFLTGHLLREITAEAEAGRMLSSHFHDNSILVNTTSGVKLYQFSKVFWDRAGSAAGGQRDALAQDGLAPEKPHAASHRKPPAAQVASPSRKRAEQLHHTRLLFAPDTGQTTARGRRGAAKPPAMLSERAAGERMKRRGLHHPLTRDSILLRVSAIQRAQCVDEVSLNMECNARLRDSWGPRTPREPRALKESPHTQTQTCPRSQDGPPRRAKTCVPILKRAAGQDVAAAPGATARRHHRSLSHQAQPRSAKEGLRAPGCTLPHRQHGITTSTSLPKI